MNLYNLMKVDIENNMHSITPIIKLWENLYACRTWSSYDSNKIKYDRNYGSHALYAPICRDVSISRCSTAPCLSVKCTTYELKVMESYLSLDQRRTSSSPTSDTTAMAMDTDPSEGPPDEHVHA